MTLTPYEREIIHNIKAITQKHNLNNVTRTKAYLDFYLCHSDMHWAFLGHMVSRNGGWNMTDLKGEFLAKLLSVKEQKSFFHFLERGNWLIFQDVYPQFLLYEESLRHQRPLFHLLPHLNVSFFMETLWEFFWEYRDPYIHCMALVINEQSYLEQRVVQNPLYAKEIFNTIKFHLHHWLSFNQIVFPSEGRMLKGQTLHQFQSLHERITLGKRLYAVLFKNSDFTPQALAWAQQHPHTGSRKDYWPHLFNDVNDAVPGITYPLKLKACHLREGANRVYSPQLKYAWRDIAHTAAESGDWYTHGSQVVEYLADDIEPMDGEINKEYCKTLERLEVAALAKKTMNLLQVDR